jgi:hypothetical protein
MKLIEACTADAEIQDPIRAIINQLGTRDPDVWTGRV